MNLYAVSIAYMDPAIMAASVAQFYKTSGVIGAPTIDIYPEIWGFVDNKWPMINPDDWLVHVYYLRRFISDSIIFRPEKNLGGHGGLTFGLKNMPIKDDDLVLNYDLDSWPVTPGWFRTMVDVMLADKTLGYIALMPNRIEKTREWKFETIAGSKIAFHPETEMWNVTLFRGSVIKDGMLADSEYYGFVEPAMQRKIQAMGLRFGYLWDYREDNHPIPHPEIYNKYKFDHARGNCPGSFEEYLEKMKGIKP